MEKVLLVVTAVILAVLMISFAVGATNPADVGKIPDIIPVNSNFYKARDLIIKEYNRGIQTRSTKHRGKKYFDYGESTKEYVHLWSGDKQYDQYGNPFYNACVVQHFEKDNGLDIFEKEWNCILITKASLEKGEAYTVRDGIASRWGNDGSVNSEWGMPTDNQRWVYGDYDSGPGMYCYQTFDWGYAMGLNGATAFVNFYRYNEGNVPPTGGDYDYDWGINLDSSIEYMYPIPTDPVSEITIRFPPDESGSDVNTSSTGSSDESKSEVLPGIVSDGQEGSSVSEGTESSLSSVPAEVGVSNPVGEVMQIADAPKFSGVKITLMIIGAVIIIGLVAATIVFSEHLILKKKENPVTEPEEQTDSEE